MLAEIMPIPQFARDKAIEILKVEHEAYLEYYRFPKIYGSSAGPFNGIGLCAMTKFPIEVWAYNGMAIIACKGRIVTITDKWNVNGEWETPAVPD
jgi:hypothetical protein